MDKFYYVFVDGELAKGPQKRHATYDDALEEASRLILEAHVRTAFVCEVQAEVKRAYTVQELFPKSVARVRRAKR